MPKKKPDPPQRVPRYRRTESDPTHPGFLPESLDKSIIAIPLLDQLDKDEETRAKAGKDESSPPDRYHVIIDLNLAHAGNRDGARVRVLELLAVIDKEKAGYARVHQTKTELSSQYVFAVMNAYSIRTLVARDNPGDAAPSTTRDTGVAPSTSTTVEAKIARMADFQRAIYRVWPDFKVRGFLTKSVSTVKADAARSSFAASGKDIVWAVIDSGVENHPHFFAHKNLEVELPLAHEDFTAEDGGVGDPHRDDAGHGTHVAGIIAGQMAAQKKKDGSTVPDTVRAVTRHWDEKGGITYNVETFECISGMAPECKIVSFKVLDATGSGFVSNILSAIERIQRLNGNGRRLLIHGVNLSVGYDFEPEWFACGHSPLCVEVDRLVRSGVVVVTASGNTGYGFQTTKFEGTVAAGMTLSINDPGNAELAITVGSTHRDMPFTYGVSYFSSKGPTGDGRPKPDLVAPGEKVISCAAGDARTKAATELGKVKFDYVEQSGTSMAAPHVSGVIAAFLSIRREFIGEPLRVKEIFTSTATDLKRDRSFQGHGLVDLMRAIQSV